jgi:hypothetical protein
MSTVRLLIPVLTSETTIERIMVRRKCSRKMAIEEIRCAWEIETANMEPVLDPDDELIHFEAGGAE